MTQHAGTGRGRGGRPAQLHRQDIIRAAVAVIDAEGAEALTMRRLGTELGVAAMSLYRHLPNRAAVLAAVVDHLVAEAATEPEPTASWHRAARDFAGAYRAVLLRHPRAVPLLATHPVSIDTGLALMNGVLARFAAEGIAQERALTVLQSVGVFTLGHALAQTGTGPADDLAYYDAWYEEGLAALLDGFRQRLGGIS